MNNLSTNILQFKPYVVRETGIRHMSHDATTINIKSIKAANLVELINDLAVGRIAAVVIEDAIRRVNQNGGWRYFETDTSPVTRIIVARDTP